jgi:hypothetical protein
MYKAVQLCRQPVEVTVEIGMEGGEDKEERCDALQQALL